MELKSANEAIFCQEDFTVKSFDAFDDMRSNEELVDFRISLENRSVSCHRLVLAARIPRFREIFCSREEEVSLNEVDPNALESIINFAYNGKIKITTGNVASLVSASKALQVTPVYDACWEFLERTLHSKNVLEVRRLAEDHGCVKVLETADYYIKQHFEELTYSESFLDLSFQELKDVVSRDDINVSTEEKVFEAVVRWVNRCPSERRDFLPELLRCVRMYFLTPSYLIERVSAEELVRASLPCRDLVDEVKSYHLLPNKRSKFFCLPSQPRCFYTSHDSFLPHDASHETMYCPSPVEDQCRNLLHAVCDFGETLHVKLFDLQNKSWLPTSTYRNQLSESMQAVSSVDGVIYIFMTSVVHMFNINTLQWNSSEFEHDVSHSGSVSFNGRIYFFGSHLREAGKVRCFDPKQKKLLDECSMSRRTQWPGVAVVDPSTGACSTSEVAVYVTGGVFFGVVSNSVERYIPKSKRWSQLSPMSSERYGHGCCDLNGKIYACGGMGKGMELGSVEVYDPLTNRWNVISSMMRPTCFPSVTSYDGKLYGYWNERFFKTEQCHTEIYEPKKNEWKIGERINYWNVLCTIYLTKSIVTRDIYKRALKESRASVW